MSEKADDAIPFSQWMERALYDPQRGYYSRRIAGIGRRGDFSTSATLDPSLGEAVAAWIKLEKLRYPNVRTIIEVGGGDGSLAQVVLKSLGWLGRCRWRFLMVESSPVLREQQQRKLHGYRVEWFGSPAEALARCDGAAFFYHNELMDAFPVTLLQWSGDERIWREVWVERSGDAWRELLRPFSTGEKWRQDFAVLREWSVASPPPYPVQRCELGVAAREWLESLAAHWKQGAMLTLDYGGEFGELYHRRPAGTLRAYLLHQVVTGPAVYQNMGRQDMTADVNFTDLAQWSRTMGWTCDPLLRQREFLQRFLPSFEKRAMKNPALAFLAEEDGAGAAFKALVSRKDA